MGEPIPLHISGIIESPIDQVKTLARRIHAARTELAEHPGYPNAATLHKLIRERKALIADIRGDIHIAYNFDKELVEDVVKICG